jgi:pRiA4b ORF-3-like protein
MADRTGPPIYQVYLWIRQISPMIWRRVLVRRESTLAQLHDVIQIVFGWSDAHLHRFRIGVPIATEKKTTIFTGTVVQIASRS